MKIPHCDNEAAVIEAIRADRWDGEIREHAEACAVCAEVAGLARLMREFHAEEAASAPLPDPGPIWWRAELFARQDAARRAARPIAVAETFAQIAGIAVGGVLLIWQGPRIREWLSAVGALAEGARTLMPILQSHLLLIGSLALLPLILALSLLGTARAGD